MRRDKERCAMREMPDAAGSEIESAMSPSAALRRHLRWRAESAADDAR